MTEAPAEGMVPEDLGRWQVRGSQESTGAKALGLRPLSSLGVIEAARDPAVQA